MLNTRNEIPKNWFNVEISTKLFNDDEGLRVFCRDTLFANQDFYLNDLDKIQSAMQLFPEKKQACLDFVMQKFVFASREESLWPGVRWVMNHFPELKERCHEHILSNLSKYLFSWQFVTVAVQDFPESRDIFCNFVFEPKNAEKLFLRDWGWQGINIAVELFPESRQRCLDFVFEPKNVDKFFIDNYQWQGIDIALKTFPESRHRCLDLVFEPKSADKLLRGWGWQGINIAVEVFPESKQGFFDYIFENPRSFFKGLLDIKNAIKDFPEIEGKCRQYLFENIDTYINTPGDIAYAKTVFPEYKDIWNKGSAYEVCLAGKEYLEHLTTIVPKKSIRLVLQDQSQGERKDYFVMFKPAVQSDEKASEPSPVSSLSLKRRRSTE